MTFDKVLNEYSWESVQENILRKGEGEVRRALNKTGNRTLEDFEALISPAAAPFLEDMAKQSQEITQKRFGKTLQMYAPLYVSSECQNICTYCGFSMDNPMRRKTLSDREMVIEGEAVRSMGFEHVLLVSGEANRRVGAAYFKNAVKLLRPLFAQISLEVQPLEAEEYAMLIEAGVHTVLVYQETYRRDTYNQYHPKGKKSLFDYRLQTPDRLGAAGAYKIGLGSLIGLEDWRTDSFFTALHLRYLERRYWRSRFSVSFPRLRPFQGSFHPNVTMSDKELVQLICAYRLLNEDLELSLSTRETPEFRDHAIGLGVTSISAGSRTNPGGYAVEPQSLKQFEISDDRDSKEVAGAVRRLGYDPVWKDWDAVLE